MSQPLYIESGGASICKYGEILCGDSLSVASIGDGKLMVLSPGSRLRGSCPNTMVMVPGSDAA